MGFRIENESLAVEIGTPGEEYAGARFDWTAFIRQVTLKTDKGAHTFCGPESLIEGRGSGGAGLCNEFGIHMPIGYDETAPGGQFPKLGIGLLTRPDEDKYNFFRAYEIAPADIRTETDGTSAVFVAEPSPVNGYAARLEKRITLHGAELRIDYALTNTGEKPIATHEYNHNFLAIDGAPVGPAYELRFGGPLKAAADLSEVSAALLDVGEAQVNWRKQVDGTFYLQSEGWEETTPYYWELRHTGTGAGLRESGSAPAIRIALWGEPHILSPEIFVDVRVAPGERLQWQRSYTFFAEN